MKKITLVLAIMLSTAFALLAQSVPQGMNYQAVARDHSGKVMADQQVTLRVTLLTQDEKGIQTASYSENHDIRTNQLGLFTLVIGQGEPASGDFEEVPWSTEDIWMELALDAKDGNDFEILNNTRLLTVPYAFHAATAGEVTGGNASEKAGAPFWKTSGNNGTSDQTNFLGTTDDNALVFKTNNQERMRLRSGGDLQMSGNNIKNLADPVDMQDAVTKGYVDGSLSAINDHISQDNDLSPTNELQNWSNLPGIPADIADGDQVNDADADPTNELQDWSNLPGIPADIADGDQVNDADADPTNELQNWSNLPGIPADIADGDQVDDADADPTNELQNWNTLPGIPADIADGDQVDDADADPTNELQYWSNLPGIPADIVDGDQVDDADADPTNELQNWNNLPGIPADIADGDQVNDADADPTNEFNTSINLNGTTLELTDAGGTITAELGALDATKTLIEDNDQDTKIQVEESGDEDIIRFDMGGIEYFNMKSGRLNIKGTGNSVFIGNSAGNDDDLSFNHNVAVGEAALSNNTSGENNVAIGGTSLINNTTGNHNVASGRSALFYNESGSYNVATGGNALIANSTGNNNVAAGHNALFKNQSGNNNVATGAGALFDNITGSNNTAIGINADVSSGNLQNATAIGANALVSQSNSLVLGKNAKVGIGTSSPAEKLHVVGNVKIEDGNQAVGKVLTSDANGVASWQPVITSGSTLIEDTDQDTKIQVEESGDEDIIRFDIGGTEHFRMNNATLEVLNTGLSVFIGEKAGFNDAGFDNRNTAIGYHSMRLNTLGRLNTASGTVSLYSNTSGSYNIASGYASLYSNTSGNFNTSSGVHSLYSNTNGSSNIAIGYASLYSNMTGDYNTASGYLSLYQNTYGSYNTASGHEALRANSIGEHNTAIGENSLISNTTGNKNTAIGSNADVSVQNLNNATAIGANAEVSQSNSMVLGSINGVNGATSDVNVGIGTTAPSERLHVVGNVKIEDGNQAVGKVLTSDASGVASWQTLPNGASDNLGNHTATQNIELNGKWLSNDGGNEGVFVKADGKVGIGASNPSKKLQVNGNTKLDGTVQITGGNPEAGHVLTATDNNGNAQWRRVKPTMGYSKISETSTFPDVSDWEDVTGGITLSNSNNKLFKVEANMTLRLTEGTNVDNFQIWVHAVCNTNNDHYTNHVSYTPDEGAGDHNNWQIVSYLDMVEGSTLCNGDDTVVTFTLQVRNTGDDGWEIRDRILIVSEY